MPAAGAWLPAPPQLVPARSSIKEAGRVGLPLSPSFFFLISFLFGFTFHPSLSVSVLSLQR